MAAIIKGLLIGKARRQRLGRQLGWFVAIWAASVAVLFVVATLIRLATAP